ncbi:MAG: TRL-like family protein [Alphaproteobacteria bacterium]|jgi:hypothetical protein|nr:TRL-like family protein [Alphaproteobacteria bacterium]
MKKVLLTAIIALTASCATRPHQVTNVKVAPSELKVGKSCEDRFLHMFPMGSKNGNSILRAKESAGITQIMSVDVEGRNWILGSTECTIVTGK